MVEVVVEVGVEVVVEVGVVVGVVVGVEVVVEVGVVVGVEVVVEVGVGVGVEVVVEVGGRILMTTHQPLAERLCELGIACLFHLNRGTNLGRTTCYFSAEEFVSNLREIARGLELREASDAEMHGVGGLAVDQIDRQWVAILARVTKGQHGHECEVSEAAPAKVSDSIVLALAGRLQAIADQTDLAIDGPTTKPAVPPFLPGYLDGP